MTRAITHRRTDAWRLATWSGLLLAGLAGYLWLRAVVRQIPIHGTRYLGPGLVLAAVAALAGVLALLPARVRPQRAELALLLLGGLVFRAVNFGLSPTLSFDAYRYAWDAQLVAHGVSPWAHIVIDPALAALRDHAIWPNVNWRDSPTIYPPGAQVLFLVIHLIAPLKISVVQAAMTLCDLATCALTLVLLRTLGLDAHRVVIYWWNPIPILEFSFSAHVDAAATALVLLALLLALRARRAGGRILGGAALGLAALVKLYPLVYMVALPRKRDWPFLGGLIAALVLIPLPFLRLGYGSGGFLGTYFGQRFIDEGLAFRLVTALVPGALPQLLAQFGLLALTCAGVLWLRVHRGWGEPRALLALTVAWLLLSPHIFPWYVGGLLPLLALELGLGAVARRAATLAIWLFALAVPFTYVVFAPGVNSDLFLLFFLVPLAVALAPWLPRLAAAPRVWRSLAPAFIPARFMSRKD
jgi:hypothetical protein